MPNELRITPDWLARQPFWMKASATLVFGIILVIAVFLSIQDYQTSRLGYLLIPSQKLDPELTATLVGMLPQAFQIALAWVGATRKQGRRLVLALWLLAFMPDFLTDLAFKMDGVAWTGEFGKDVVIAGVVLAETLILYTGGSELMIMFAWANISPLIAPTIGGALGGFWTNIRESFAHAREAAAAAAAEAGRESGALFNLEVEPPPSNTRGTAKKRHGGR